MSDNEKIHALNVYLDDALRHRIWLQSLKGYQGFDKGYALLKNHNHVYGMLLNLKELLPYEEFLIIFDKVSSFGIKFQSFEIERLSNDRPS